MDKKVVIEHVRGKLKSGVDEKTVMEALDAMHEFIEKYSGFISREIFKGEDGLIGALVYWNSLEEAKQAEKLVHESPISAKLFSLLDPDSMGVEFLEVIKKY